MTTSSKFHLNLQEYDSMLEGFHLFFLMKITKMVCNLKFLIYKNFGSISVIHKLWEAKINELGGSKIKFLCAQGLFEVWRENI